MFIVFSV